MNALFIDIETSGLPSKEMKWDVDYKNFPRIVSISWKFKEEMTSTIINQRGIPIPEGAIAVHGITNDRANQSEYTIDSVLLWLIDDALEADKIIGFNLYFDTSIIKANAIREFGPKSSRVEQIIEGLDKLKRIDVMRSGAKFMHGWSTLGKMYLKLFNETFTAHNSYDDVLAVERCYNELVRLEIIK